jgi:hypothetical protein
MNAVISADLIDYTKLTIEQEDLVINSIYETFESDTEIRTNVDSSFVITRGDSIQIELDIPEQALQAALLLKSGINKTVFVKGNRTPDIDVRIAIGIGEISKKRPYVNESTGDAYIYSGRTLDLMKQKRRRLAIKTFSDVLNNELETEFQLLEVILANWTVQAAEAVYWTLRDLNENEISEKLGITQSAVNQRKKTAGWKGIETLLERFSELIRKG